MRERCEKKGSKTKKKGPQIKQLECLKGRKDFASNEKEKVLLGFSTGGGRGGEKDEKRKSIQRLKGSKGKKKRRKEFKGSLVWGLPKAKSDTVTDCLLSRGESLSGRRRQTAWEIGISIKRPAS